MWDVALYVHIAAAGIALLAGFAALVAKKGSLVHKKAGRIFVFTMIIMAVPAAGLAHEAGKPFDALAGLVAIYMVLTSMLTFRSISRNASIAITLLAIACFAGYLAVELGALVTGIRAPDAPPGAGYIFASVLGLAVWGDFRRLRKTLPRRQSVIRHLWRMNFALLLATVSFFGARPHLFPEWMQSSGALILLSFAPLLVMAYWRVKFRAKPALSA